MNSFVLKKAELQNDERANVLYSPFRIKTLNPSSWTDKMNFWQKFLKEVASEEKILIFDVHKLPQMFERKGIIPKCLPTVLDELQRYQCHLFFLLAIELVDSGIFLAICTDIFLDFIDDTQVLLCISQLQIKNYS